MNYISREAVIKELDTMYDNMISMGARFYKGFMLARHTVNDFPAADVREVVTCQKCIHAEPFERNCELNSSAYMHCKIGRGSEVKNVWHKYKKYYRDYSVVDRDGYCDEGAMMGGQDNG